LPAFVSGWREERRGCHRELEIVAEIDEHQAISCVSVEPSQEECAPIQHGAVDFRGLMPATDHRVVATY
jgi:hypothetical protein